MKHEINRPCPLTNQFSDRVIGFVKARHVWQANSTYRERCEEILGVDGDDEYPIVESIPGFSYAGWLPPEDFLTRIYEDAIDHTKTATEQIGYRADLLHLAAAFLRIIESIPKQTGNRLRLLDFGCGYGSLLRILGSRDIEAIGFEPSPERRGKAARFADEVFADIDSVAAAGPFDLLICTEVLEHVPDPQETMTLLRSLVSPGALLCITVPQCESAFLRESFRNSAHLNTLPKVINPWEHLNYFSAATLRTILAKNQFEVVSDAGQTKPLVDAARRSGDASRFSSTFWSLLRMLKRSAKARPSTELICRAV